MQRTPDEIKADLENAFKGTADLEIWPLLWELIDDVRSSYRLAMESLSPPLDPNRVDEVQDTVLDYLVNSWGED